MPGDAEQIEGKRGQSAIEIIIAVAIVAGIFLTMFAYTANWPPLVVVESRSMQHADADSYLGIMDTGDLVLVKKINSLLDVVTYYDGIRQNHSSYGDFGDVIIYLRGGSTQQTPVIHRAVTHLEVNPDGVSFRSRDLGFLSEGVDYEFDVSSDTPTRITGNIMLHNYGFRSQELLIPISEMIDQMQRMHQPLHSGFITKGDFNDQTDQLLGISPNMAPVNLNWIVGVARGEIPWLGIVKLYLTGDLPEYTPQNSFDALIILIVAMFAIPLAIEILIRVKGDKTESETEMSENQQTKHDEREDSEYPEYRKK